MRIFFSALLSIASFLPGFSQNVKGLYVNQFSSILANIPAEDSLLNYAQVNGFNYLALYELQIVQTQHDLTSFSASAPLAAFINKAKTQYGILNVGAVAENYWFFENRIHVYNQLHSNTNEKFDVFNLEFEFWQTAATGPSGYYCTTYLQPSGFSCDTAGAFDFYINELRKIDSLAATGGHISETYVGWPTAGQCHEINATCDRVLVHAYVTNANNAYGYTQTRLSYFGTSASSANIIVIFSSEPAFMGPWLNTNPEYTAWNTYSNGFSNETATWVSGINLIGYQWFDYTDMPYDLSMNVDPLPTAVPYYIIADRDFIYIAAGTDAPRTFTLYNSLGQVVRIQESSASTIEIPISGLSTTTYFLQVTNNLTGETWSKKVYCTNE